MWASLRLLSHRHWLIHRTQAFAFPTNIAPVIGAQTIPTQPKLVPCCETSALLVVPSSLLAFLSSSGELLEVHHMYWPQVYIFCNVLSKLHLLQANWKTAVKMLTGQVSTLDMWNLSSVTSKYWNKFGIGGLSPLNSLGWKMIVILEFQGEI